jgi:hypothetical protein
MAFEKPQVRMDIQLCLDLAFAECPTLVGDQRDPVRHEHIGQRQSRAVGIEQFTVTALQQLLAIIGILAVRRHSAVCRFRTGFCHSRPGATPVVQVNLQVIVSFSVLREGSYLTEPVRWLVKKIDDFATYQRSRQVLS